MSTLASFCDRPTVALGADQPTSLSSLLVRPSPASQAPYPPAHTSIPPAPAVFDERVIDVGAIQQEHISKGAPVLVEIVCTIWWPKSGELPPAHPGIAP